MVVLLWLVTVETKERMRPGAGGGQGCGAGGGGSKWCSNAPESQRLIRSWLSRSLVLGWVPQ